MLNIAFASFVGLLGVAFMFSTLWLLILWLNLQKDAKDNIGWFAQFIPLYLFSSTGLSEEGKITRQTFFRALRLNIALTACIVLIFIFLEKMKH